MDEDLSAFFDDFAVVATTSTESQNVLVDLPEQIFTGDHVISGKYQITYKTGLFSGLKYADAITVDGVDYTVDTVNAIGDGMLTVAALSKV